MEMKLFFLEYYSLSLIIQVICVQEDQFLRIFRKPTKPNLRFFFISALAVTMKTENLSSVSVTDPSLNFCNILSYAFGWHTIILVDSFFYVP